MTSSRFRDKFLTALGHIARSVRRVCVGSLPAQVEEWKRTNVRALRMCREGMSDEEVDSVLGFFNASFTSGWTHYCGPGCCRGGDDFYANLGANYLWNCFFCPSFFKYLALGGLGLGGVWQMVRLVPRDGEYLH